MNAQEAREKALKNQTNIEEALKFISDVSENGFTSALFDQKPLSDIAAMELMNKGYKVSKYQTPFGLEFYKADW